MQKALCYLLPVYYVMYLGVRLLESWVLKPDQPQYFLKTRADCNGHRVKYILPTLKNLAR